MPACLPVQHFVRNPNFSIFFSFFLYFLLHKAAVKPKHDTSMYIKLSILKNIHIQCSGYSKVSFSYANTIYGQKIIFSGIIYCEAIQVWVNAHPQNSLCGKPIAVKPPKSYWNLPPNYIEFVEAYLRFKLFVARNVSRSTSSITRYVAHALSTD